MTRGPTDRSHLSIGEVLSLLQDDFPDVTISKIRFLEAQGLLDPERTPSGYRKFYEADVDRLRWILRQQKDHYLPLKVIKDRLDETGPIRTAPKAAGPEDTAVTTTPDDAAAAGESADDRGRLGERHNGLAAVALDDRPLPRRPARPDDTTDHGAGGPGRPGRRTPPDPSRFQPPPSGPARSDVAAVIEPPPVRPEGDDPTLRLGTARRPAGAPAPRSGGRGRGAPDGGAVSLTADELAQASGLSPRAVRELDGYGLLETHMVGDDTYYDADALVIARTAAGFLEHGIEARHIRGYKVAAEREAALYEQIVLPLLKQRNPDARRRAEQTVAELVRLADEMRGVLLRRGLREHLPPR